MATYNKTGCEVRINGAWQPVSLTEAHTQHRAAEKRCPSCHGRVHTQGSYSAQGTVAMTHRRAHDGCPRIPKLYAGTSKPHPQVVD
ncbi:hypothetical protein MMSR116_17985 [Methylobacterium mesophilicum SR1.6/6]|uniref:Uncharacterized protein n=1 Tax=Methylobacterium mesophilicum SR1.6/6 TaxID=908290 RepID=A0A6B9FPA4_9HYPH|nr:hypothetical protein MMSR116_17985 [Methylobacterium mesophilicum SR1.6/6]